MGVGQQGKKKLDSSTPRGGEAVVKSIDDGKKKTAEQSEGL